METWAAVAASLIARGFCYAVLGLLIGGLTGCTLGLLSGIVLSLIIYGAFAQSSFFSVYCTDCTIAGAVPACLIYGIANWFLRASDDMEFLMASSPRFIQGMGLGTVSGVIFAGLLGWFLETDSRLYYSLSGFAPLLGISIGGVGGILFHVLRVKIISGTPPAL